MDEVDDVFHLRFEEVARICDPADVPDKQAADLRTLIRQRPRSGLNLQVFPHPGCSVLAILVTRSFRVHRPARES